MQTIELAKLVFEPLGELFTKLCKMAGVPDFFIFIALKLIIGGILLGFLAVSVMLIVWLERKIMARFQSRIGPLHVGPHGLLQSIADGMKLFVKEDLIPMCADRWVHLLAPIIIFVPPLLAFIVIPFEKRMLVADLNIGLLFIFAVSSVTVISIVMGGWASNNKYTLFGAFRSAAQMVSYEIPLLMSVLGVVMLVGNLKLSVIVNAQANIFEWFIWRQPLGFLIYLIAGIAELNRVPFDIPEAESELVAGFHTEYSGMKFAFFFLAEYSNLFLICAIITTVFLGGWQSPFGSHMLLPPIVWFFIKSYFLVFILMWIRWTLPRMRVDKLMSFSWKYLIPGAFLNIILTGIYILVFKS